mgnify:CR=1 FL=1
MENIYKIEIVSPEKVIFSDENVQEVTLPSYEGEMGILKNHIPIITFLRPGIIKIKKNNNHEDFFVEDGIVEFFNDNLTVLSSAVKNINNLSKDFIEELSSEIAEKLKNENLTDEDKYLLHHKLDVIKAIKL